MIICSPAPWPIIKAALLAQIHNDLPCFHGEQDSLGLFKDTAIHNADTVSLATLTNQLSDTCGLDVTWLLGSPGQTLARLVAANLRYQASDRAAVVFAAAEQALRYGHSYCFCGIGDISRIFISRAKVVSHEVHKMLGFIRFTPAPNNTLVARPKLFHQTADLILKKFVSRYPNTCLVLILDDTALMLKDGVIAELPAAAYLPYIEDRDFAAAWETYYQSQYIATRKNIKLAQHAIPKKYWDWLAEGKILKNEASK
ncbi:DUF4130 domain-containing protein [Sporomusa malonica]|uniref:Probable DNA metabolism protein n=1 Tax=Sporomusa malonica TaxID=112901 RepID=A0A1W1ZE57_9FIRM|nr:DUF4130 domain-containing protein [Sporomusa malonica]SMC46677.1 probable DNA metabolism protein [Sporomusa malonica]